MTTNMDMDKENNNTVILVTTTMATLKLGEQMHDSSKLLHTINILLSFSIISLSNMSVSEQIH